MGKSGQPRKDLKGVPDPKDGSCGARSKSTGKPCRRKAGWGTSHAGQGRCRYHGGASPQAELAGVVELARREAAVMGQPLEIEPHDAILQCIRIAAGEVRYASDRIATLEDWEAAAPVVTSIDRNAYGEDAVSYDQTTSGPPALNVWIETRHRAMDRLVNYSKIALAAGVEERKVQLAERAGEMMASLIRSVLTELGVPLEDPKTREVVVRNLRLIEGGQVA